RAAARMSERAPKEQLRVADGRLVGLAERIAGIPRRALLEMLANALARCRGRGVRGGVVALHAGSPPNARERRSVALLLFLGDPFAPEHGAVQNSHFGGQTFQNGRSLVELRRVLPWGRQRRRVQGRSEFDALQKIVVVFARVKTALELERRLDELLRFGVFLL